ncbi:MAG: hypothetical protein WDO74_21055 [Pseudomonadota bacterium]
MSSVVARIAQIVRQRRLLGIAWLFIPAFFLGLTWYGLTAPVSDSCRFLGRPFSDAGNYLDGATRLTYGMSLPLVPANRPLYSVYLSTWLEVTGHSLIWTFMLQALIVAGGICWFCWHVAREHGRIVSLVAGFVVTAFFVRFAGKTMSETLGFPLGLLSWGWLLAWVRSEQRWQLFVSYFALTLGLMARAGPFFILPAILIALVRQRGLRRSFTTVAVLSLAVALPVALHRAYHLAWSTQTGGGFSNFAYTLYGVARGGKGWRYAYAVVPGAVTSTQVVYRAAIDSIIHQPQLFVFGALKSVAEFLYPNLGCATGFTCRVVPGRLQPLVWAVTQLSFLFGSWRVLRSAKMGRSRLDSIYCWSLLGLLASVPFAPPSDADLMRAYATAIPLLAIVTGLGVQEFVDRVFKLPDTKASVSLTANEGGGVAEQRFIAGFPCAILALTLICLLRPLLRVHANPVQFGDGEHFLDSPTTVPNTTSVECGPNHYQLDILSVSHTTRLASRAYVEHLQAKSFSSPRMFEPLKPVVEKAGPLDYQTGFVSQTGNTWALLVPPALQQRLQLPNGPIKICAEKLDSSSSGADGVLHALLVKTVL